jgi:hypothetical protein
MDFFLYRHPLYDELAAVFLGGFKTYRDAEIARDNVINDDWYFYEDFYIVDNTNG